MSISEFSSDADGTPVSSAIPFVQEVAPTGYGWGYETPKVHRTEEPSADFLRELRKDRLSLMVDDSFPVEQHHDALSTAL